MPRKKQKEEETEKASLIKDEKAISRRGYLVAAGGIAAAAAVGGAAYYLSTQGPGPEQVTKGKLGCMVPTWANEYYYWYDYGVSEVATALDCEHRILTCEWDASKEVTNAQSFVAAGLPMIVTEHIDDASAYQVERICQDNKVYYATTWNIGMIKPWEMGDYFVHYNIPDCLRNARDIANVLCKAMDEKGKLAYIEGQVGESTSEMRNLSFTETIAKYPNIELVKGATGFWETPTAQRNMEDLLTTHPDVDGLLGANDAIVIGMLAACEAHGITDIPAVGIDAVKTAVEYIMQDKMTASVSVLPSYQAGLNAVHVYDAWKGWEFTNEERAVNTECVIIGKGDVKQIHPGLEQPAVRASDFFSEVWGDKFAARGGKTPWDWRKMSRVVAQEEGSEVDITGGWYGGTTPLDMDAFFALIRQVMED